MHEAFCLIPIVAFPCDNFVLQLSADAREIRVVTRNAHEQVLIILRMMLRVNELMDAEMTRETEAEISEKDRQAADQAVFEAIAAMVAAPEAE